MARAIFVKKARKDNSAVKAGESYWWWSFRFGGKYYSKTRPRPSQLTQSEFTSQILEIGEEIEDISDLPFVTNVLDLESLRDDLASKIRELGEEQDSKRENMPEGLQEGPTGELLENRYDACETMADELDNIDIDADNYEGDSSDPDNPSVEWLEWLQGLIEEIQNVAYEGE